MIPRMTYAEIYELREWMVAGVRVWKWMVAGVRVWKWRCGGRDHFWMLSWYSLLFFSSLDLGSVQMASAWVFTTFGVNQVEVDFPRAPDPPKGRHQAVPIVCGTYEFVRLRT